MPDVIKYVNARGEAVNFSSPPFFVNSKQLRQFAANSEDGVIDLFPKGTASLLTVMLISKAERNRFFNILDYDAMTNQRGRLYINDWYMPCFFKGITGIVYEDDNTFKGTLDFDAEKMEFLKETKYKLQPKSDVSGGLNYPHNVPYNYSANKFFVSKIKNNEVADADFIFEFTGAADSVEFAIGDTRYVVNARFSADDRFELNTLEKTVLKTNQGERIDLFGLAEDDSYIYAPVPSGEHVVAWVGSYTINFTLIEHRRFAEWT